MVSHCWFLVFKVELITISLNFIYFNIRILFIEKTTNPKCYSSDLFAYKRLYKHINQHYFFYLHIYICIHAYTQTNVQFHCRAMNESQYDKQTKPIRLPTRAYLHQKLNIIKSEKMWHYNSDMQKDDDLSPYQFS